MVYLPDSLEDRGRLIGEAVAGSPIYRWDGYGRGEDLHGWQHADDEARYTREGDGKGRLHLFNIQPVDVRDLVESEPFTLDSKVIDALSTVLDNLEGRERDLEQRYTADFGNLKTKESAFKSSLTVALKTAFTFGGEASQIKNETSLEISTTNEWEKRQGETDSVSRLVEWDLAAPPGYSLRFHGQRKVSKQRVTVSGWGDLEHSIQIGKRAKSRGRWGWGAGAGYWTTFADFMRTIKGEAPDSWNYAGWFREHPVAPSLIEALEEPARVPFTMDLEFDHVTDTRLRKFVLDMRDED